MRSRREAVRNQRIALIVAASAIILCIAVIRLFLLDSINAQAATAQISYKYYTSVQIQKGDTLWTIAGDYITDDYADMNEYIDELRALNHIQEDRIHAGEYLTVPYYSAEYLE